MTVSLRQIGSARHIGDAACIAIAFYHLMAIAQVPQWLGFFVPLQVHAAISLSGALLATFLIADRSRGPEAGPARWMLPRLVFNVLLTAAGIASLTYVVFDFEAIMAYTMIGSLDGFGITMALLLVVPLIEGVRRKAGIVLPIIILCLVGLVLYQPYMPGILYGRGYSPERLLYAAYVGSSGIFGIPLRVAADIIIVFIIFGALFQASGSGRWFIDLALALTGRRPGGPAKAAVVASAMFGSISGSPSGNAATTGVFTIPLMKSVGYSSRFAAAVEAVASTGGQILPPVMGAIAFIMADWTGRTYPEVVRAALIPAILYMSILYFSVHFQAKRVGIAPLTKAQIKPIGQTMRNGWFYLIPIAALIFFLFVRHLPPAIAGVLCLPFVIGVSFLNQDRSCWLTPRRLAGALISAVHNWKGIAVITAAVGIMVGAMDLSGVGIKLSDFIIDLSGGHLLLALLMVGLASLILGMGLDSIPAYVTLATLLAPALVKLGVPDIAAHLFVVYWGLASFFTPPLCIAVYVTTSISGSRMWETGWESVKLGIGAFLIPFAFALGPGLLLIGGIGEIVQHTATAFVGAVAVAAGLRGYLLAPLSAVLRSVLVIGGCTLIYPDLLVSLTGIVLVTAVALLSWSGSRTRVASSSEPVEGLAAPEGQ